MGKTLPGHLHVAHEFGVNLKFVDKIQEGEGPSERVKYGSLLESMESFVYDNDFQKHALNEKGECLQFELLE